MFGDVIAHIVGEELKRGNPNLVPVTREKFVQNKLKELRRASGEINLCELRVWAEGQGLSQVCLVKAEPGSNSAFSFTSNAQQSYSVHRINVAAAGLGVFCKTYFIFEHTGAPREMTSTELTKVAWEVVGRLQSSSCKPFYIKCHPFEPEMVFVEGGTYKMRGNCNVTLSSFWIGKYEITQSEWAAVMGVTFEEWVNTNVRVNASLFGKGDNYPAYYISYNDALAFISALNTRTSQNYRLPTEAEWEYAARGGSVTPKFCSGGCEYSGSDTLWHVAWHGRNSGFTSHEVGTRKTQPNGGTSSSPVDGGNELGIHDMTGNVSEWCKDWFSYDISCNVTNPSGPKGGDDRVTRGGDWYDAEGICPLSYRTNHRKPNLRELQFGFRVVLP
jgi:formylglycine-generating enzyme required for sulfatase activity